VSLIPSTGGVFTVDIIHAVSTTPNALSPTIETRSTRLWDRKTEGGFPETKELKKRVRDIIDPGRDLGHVDGRKKTPTLAAGETSTENQLSGTEVAGVTSSGGIGEVQREPQEKKNLKLNPDGTVCEDCN